MMTAPTKLLFLASLVQCLILTVSAFLSPSLTTSLPSTKARLFIDEKGLSAVDKNHHHDDPLRGASGSPPVTSTVADQGRRNILQSTASITVSSLGIFSLSGLSPAIAADDATTIDVPMKTFVDNAKPSLFSIDVPQRFFAIRRSAKGDLPDSKTGQGRRGGTIFTAGDMSKAEVIAVERFPTRVLLEEEGYQPSGDLTTFPSIGDPTAIANLLIRRREKDKPGAQNTAALIPNSVSLSPDGMTMTFQLRQQINVEKPELLMETMGVTELFRTTVAKATLGSNDGNLMVVFASALDQDFAGVDGLALRKSVDSFAVTDQSGAV